MYIFCIPCAVRTLYRQKSKTISHVNANCMEKHGFCQFHISKLPLPTGQKAGKLGQDFPTFIHEASRLHIILKNRALIKYLHLHSLEHRNTKCRYMLYHHDTFF